MMTMCMRQTGLTLAVFDVQLVLGNLRRQSLMGPSPSPLTQHRLSMLCMRTWSPTPPLSRSQA